jgi:hypothetical protein
MTVPAMPPMYRPSAALVTRIAGVLFVISALGTIGKQAIGQIDEYQTLSPTSNEPEFAWLGPLLFFAALEAVPLIVAFVLIYVSRPKTVPSIAFLVLAAMIPAGFIWDVYPGVEPTYDIVHAAIALFAGVYVVVAGVFGRGTSISFGVAMLAFAAVLLLGLTDFLVETLWGGAVAAYIVAVTYLVFGVCLAARPSGGRQAVKTSDIDAAAPKTRSTATE